MTIEEMCSLPIKTLADDNARIFLWTTNRYLPNAFLVLSSWGFTYKQTIIWRKVGNPSPWGGSVAPNHAEFLLVGTVGNPPRREMLKSNIIEANVGRHSEKPAFVRDLILRVCGDVSRVELFARKKELGWDVWGNEVESDIELSASPKEKG